ncbi:glycosyl transferase family 1 [Aliiruegeria haliotis]|uniref:Glycosyl transferase family 1 n=1 Tax=Aliiruegeria haliotis TaxID=1280846 RepID=A0A2T0RP86_9RHOB|nr:glycosyltransferase [Aliiruegeria haliotis]PRY23005.1 glycosyl transferase family 1 [Aliiruegeria haliotis]
MKILYYNWVDYLDAEKRGGGVTVYQKNLITHLGQKSDVDVYSISSGISYDMFSNAPRWEPVRHGSKENRARRFEIINSAVMSPGHHAFGHRSQLNDEATVQVFFDFIETHGPFDVVHFNNLEGIPAAAMTLKERFPDTKVIFSLHNYFPVCPQVNLWQRERRNCLDFEGGRKCTDCLLEMPKANQIRQANALAYVLKKNGIAPGTGLFRTLFGPAYRLANKALRVSRKWSSGSREVLDFANAVGPDADVGEFAGKPLYQRISLADYYSARREKIVAIMNENCDRILCVSNRVGEVAAKFGLDPALLETSYIGTQQADLFEKTEAKPSLVKEDGTVTLGFLGYMRRDKGFYFLMRALKSLPEDLANRINLVVCAKTGEEDAMARLNQVGNHLNDVLHADGYSHNQLDALLERVDVGVVPVQWEDNLPQVAIEMHARHIPLLTSDLGGAQELGNTPSMVFEANSIKSFESRIRDILDGKVDLEAYWANAMPPVSMQDHEAQLLDLYRRLVSGVAAAA